MFAESEIRKIVSQALPGCEVYVSDMTGTKDHFRVEVKAPQFRGLLLVEQHRMVMDALKDNISDDKIHAVSIKTKAL